MSSADTRARGIVAGAFEGKASPRRAIKACCLACTCYDRAQVENCAVVLCPLYEYRPAFDRKLAERSDFDEKRVGEALSPTRATLAAQRPGKIDAVDGEVAKEVFNIGPREDSE